VDAGGDVGVVHRACFARWDNEQEALEQMLARSLGAPHHAEANLELELPTDAAAKSSPSLLPGANSVARADVVRSAAA
jgi:anti-sigma factor RsiW